MAKQKLTKGRLISNGVGTLGIVVFFLPFGLQGVIGLVTGAAWFGKDPDGADKVLMIQMFSAVVGAVALFSLIRTIRAWRALPKEAAAGSASKE